MASANLPESLVEDILSRLPVKSLKRFTCVSKSWSTLFQNPGFIAKHHHHFSQKNPTLLFSLRDRITKNTVLSSHPVSNDNGSLDLNLEIPFFNDDMQELNILGACINGVICLYDRPFLISNQHPNDDLYRIALWNPAIREFKVLPTRHVHCPSHVDYTYEGFGFGYDHKSNDYKVVRIVSFWDDSIVGPDRPPLVEVYTLSTDSWRQIDTVLDASIISDPCKSEIYLNGAYHWLAYRSEQPWPHGDTELIISFDMGDEVFQIIRMPELEDVSGMILKTFCVLNDCLALIFYSAEETVTAKNFDIWMMYEYGVKGSWIKQFVVGPLVGIERPLGFAKNGELLLVGNNGQVVLYNFGSGETKNLEVRGLPDSFHALQTITYVESLVSITNRIVFQN